MAANRRHVYQDLSRQFIESHMITDLQDVQTDRPIVLIRMRDVYICQFGSTWRPVHTQGISHECDIQLNVNNEDLMGICGIFNDISDDIIQYHNQHQENQALVIINTRAQYVRGNRKQSQLVSYADMASIPSMESSDWKRDNDYCVYLYDIPTK